MSSGWNMFMILLRIESISLGFNFDLVWHLEAYRWVYLQTILMKVALKFNSKSAGNANQAIADFR